MLIAETEPRRHHGKSKETHKFIFSWLSWLAVLLVGEYDDDEVAQDSGHTAAKRETEKYNLRL